MAYKSLLSVMTDATLANGPISQGIALAHAQDAHFEVLCLGVDRSQTGYYYAGANAMVMQETLARAQEEATAIEDTAKSLLKGNGVRWSTESGVAQIADLGRHVAAHARFADLVILPKPYGKDRDAVELEPTIEAAMFQGQAPVLMVPEASGATPNPVSTPKSVLVAWNESPEALRAIRAALPFLQAAEVVHIVIIDPPAHGPNRSDPGGLISQFLARHGVNVEIEILSKTLPRVSEVLLRHATDTSSEMIVMGAYGHSRFREAILGGATRNMLESADIPVLMAH